MKNNYKKYRILNMDWINEQFRYDEITGLLYNRVNRFEGEKKDNITGYINKRGFREVMIDYKSYYQHIIIWMITHNGNLPEYELSRKNGDRSDNRLNNLIDTDHPIQYVVYGKSKFRGVSWDKCKQKWISQIRIDGKRKYIGSFKDEIDAAHAYDGAALDAGRDKHLMNFPMRSLTVSV